jgi:hypothetical protein
MPAQQDHQAGLLRVHQHAATADIDTGIHVEQLQRQLVVQQTLPNRLVSTYAANNDQIGWPMPVLQAHVEKLVSPLYLSLYYMCHLSCVSHVYAVCHPVPAADIHLRGHQQASTAADHPQRERRVRKSQLAAASHRPHCALLSAKFVGMHV